MHLFVSAFICAQLKVPVSCSLRVFVVCTKSESDASESTKCLFYTMHKHGKTQGRNAMKYLLQLLILELKMNKCL